MPAGTGTGYRILAGAPVDKVALPAWDELAKFTLLSIAFLGTNGNVSFIVFLFFTTFFFFFYMLQDLYNGT